MPEIVSLASLCTELNADAVEWCPIQGLENLLVCATYELVEDDEKDHKTEQYRRGFLYLYGLLPDLSLKELSKTETPGILDSKWSRHRIGGLVCLAAADAIGKLRLFKLNTENSTLEELSCLDLSGDSNSSLLLSLDWSNVLDPAEDSCCIVVSDSSGSVHVVSIAGSKLTLKSSRKAHEFEAWIAAYDYFNTSVFYSGGDDSKLKVHDTRVDTKNAVRTLKEHTAGVTSIQSNWLQEYSLVTGSYDERILFWDTRAMRRPQADVGAPGGVWRIKHDPFNCQLVACPCMYGGSAVLDSGLPTPQVIATYDFHKNINYGIDWCWKEVERNGSSSTLLAVCSFYDKLLSLANLSV